jgi:hypothetical protein
MTPQIDPIWPWPWVVFAAIASLVVVLTTYRQRVAHLPPGWQKVLLALRLCTWALITLAMFRPGLEITDIDRHASVFIVALDRSRSMSVKDGSEGLSRRETALKLLADHRTELEGLGKDIEITLVDFDKEATPVDEPSPETPGEQTAIGQLLDSIPKLFPEKKVVGVLLISDGAQRALPPHDLDPRAAAARLAEQQIRVDTIGAGSSGISDSARDVAVEDLEVSPTVFVKNTVVVSARIRAQGAADQELTVRLLLESPSTAAPGKPAPMQTAAPPRKIKVTRNQEVIPIEMSFLAEEAGEFKLAIEVVPLDGEPQTANNTMTTFVTVLKGGVSVAYFDQEYRAEQKFIRRIDESPDIRLDFKPVRLGAPSDKPQIEADWFEPGKYDVYIIGSVRASTFGRENLQKLRRAVEKGAGLLMTGGTRSFGPGGYADTALADLLPVVTLRTEVQNGDEPDPSLHSVQRLRMLPTSQGLSHFVMRLDSADKNLAAWKSLPELEGANRFSGVKRGGLVLAETPEKIPLLVAEDYGSGRTMAFAADTTYLWHLDGKGEAHQRFWQQVVLWLAHKDNQGDEAVWVKLEGRRFRVGQPVGMAFGARDADKRPIDDAVFKVEVTDPEGKKHELTPQRSGSDNLARLLETRTSGDYRVHVEASHDGKPVGFGSDARFLVYDQDLELHNPAADFAMLEEIAKITGGTGIPAGELGEHLRRLSRLGLNVDVTRVRSILLWDNWPPLAVFVFCMTLEWFLRKRRGLV